MKNSIAQMGKHLLQVKKGTVMIARGENLIVCSAGNDHRQAALEYLRKNFRVDITTANRFVSSDDTIEVIVTSYGAATHIQFHELACH